MRDSVIDESAAQQDSASPPQTDSDSDVADSDSDVADSDSDSDGLPDTSAPVDTDIASDTAPADTSGQGDSGGADTDVTVDSSAVDSGGVDTDVAVDSLGSDSTPTGGAETGTESGHSGESGINGDSGPVWTPGETFDTADLDCTRIPWELLPAGHALEVRCCMIAERECLAELDSSEHDSACVFCNG